MAAVISTAAAAQTAPVNFDIASGDLGMALSAYAKQSGVELFYQSRVVAGRNTQGVRGAYAPRDALDQLLKGTGLVLAMDQSGAMVVREASDPQSGSAAGDGADAGTVQALIVTAQKREEDIQDVPIAISAFTQEDLTRSQVAGGADLMTQVPNMTFTKTNFSSYSIQIRGIGTQAISATVDPAVAVAFNNTPFIRNHFFEQEFFDLERAEVLRGPQGTLYGRNATAGVVNIISAKPRHEFEAKLSGDLANYGSGRLEGMLNLPLVDDKVAVRFAGEWTKRDGFVKNRLTGEQTDGRDLWSARATLGLTPVDWFKANLIYEHFSEDDDRLRSGKQLCNKDPGPAEIEGVPTVPANNPLDPMSASYFSQGCKPASLYSPDSFQTPNGYALPYYGAARGIHAPVFPELDPYLLSTQSRSLREIETHIKPEYKASADLVELQLEFDLPGDLTLTSETGFSSDRIFSFEDYNRFDTTPGVFVPNAINQQGNGSTVIDANGVFCDPQLGCTDRLAAADLAVGRSRQFSQEFRIQSNFDGAFNFSLGANFLRYDSEDKYYVFINALTAAHARMSLDPWVPNSDTINMGCFQQNGGELLDGYAWSNPNKVYFLGEHCAYIDPNDIHHLNDEGRNYFLSKNPYNLLSYAVFGEAYYDLTPTLKLTGGIRWTVDRKTAPQIPSWLLAEDTYGLPTRTVIEQEWRVPTGRVAVDWKPQLSFTDQTLVYASYVRGYKAGGANPPPMMMVFPPVCPPDCGHDQDEIFAASVIHTPTFKAEYVDAYEAGTKNTLLDGRLTLNFGAFYYDYTGYQISEIVDRSAVNLNFDAKIWGVELESDWRPLENLRLGFKVGYESTRLADGSSAIDLMDRTAGQPGWVLKKPFPTFPSNCIVPASVGFSALCEDYVLGVNTFPAPNNGEGFSKDLSGNELPNAPHWTGTLTADYTLPLPSDWLVTLHADVYGQAEAWTRIFNTPGYDKLKAFNNVNFAAIFSNDAAGWQVMAYVKNVFDKDNITGAFLNSDDTGLTTNVFLTEPRLFGLRATRQWNGSPWWSAHAHHDPAAGYPFRLELEGYYGKFGHDDTPPAAPAVALFSADFPDPLAPQRDLDWGGGGGVKFTYAPVAGGWNASAAVRYGRARGDGESHAKQALPDVCFDLNPFGFPFQECFNPSTGDYVLNGVEGSGNITTVGKYNFVTTTATNSEAHTMADFTIGKDVGIGSRSSRLTSSSVNFGLAYARFNSASEAVMHGQPDVYFPPEDKDAFKYLSHKHVFNSDLSANREFEGAGPELAWDGSLRLAGDAERAGRIDLDVGLGGAVLFGKQKTQISGEYGGQYFEGKFYGLHPTAPPYVQPVAISRSRSVTAPVLRANLGLSYNAGGVKISGGYRAERYYNVIDGGFNEHKSYDRAMDGPYFKVSVGFGG